MVENSGFAGVSAVFCRGSRPPRAGLTQIGDVFSRRAPEPAIRDPQKTKNPGRSPGLDGIRQGPQRPPDHGVGTVAIVCRMRLAIAYGSPWEFGRRSSMYPL